MGAAVYAAQSRANTPLPNVSLEAAGLLALADLRTIANRTALTGNTTFLDALVLCPGIHRQQDATSLNGGEYPATAALTTGYVFRVENPATVNYLQKVGKTGHLTTLIVQKLETPAGIWAAAKATFYLPNLGFNASACYLSTPLLSAVAIGYLALIHDWWALAILAMLIFARLCNIMVIRRRAQLAWKGASEPGVKGDLLVLLSQDRWIRIHGLVDDLKAVTSGQWLREMTFFQSSVVGGATLMVYTAAALASNASQAGQLLLLVLLVSSVGLLALSNSFVKTLHMHGQIISPVGKQTPYARRRDLADELIKDSGRKDWAIRLGMIVSEVEARSVKNEKAPVSTIYEEEVTM